jgi:competence protein ComEC
MRGRGRYPGLAVLALAWVGGGTLALAGSTLIPLWILAVATGIALLGSLRLRFVLVIAVALAGGLWTTQAARRGLDARLPRAFEGQTLTVVGRVVGLPRNQPRRVRFTLAIDTAQSAHGAGVDGLRRIALSWYRPPATIPRVGERWRFQVRLQRPRSLRNPGSFDYAGWAFAHGINATGYVYHNHGIRLAPAGAGLGPVRARIARAVDRALPASPWAGLVAGLAVGARGGMTPAQWQTLRATGTSHLLAISGLHLGLVAVLVFLLTSLIVRRFPALTRRVPTRLVAAGAGLLAALVYAALAGFSLPTQRALIMLAAPLLALLSRRRLGVGAALGLAAVVVTLITPLAVLSASFWLSFGAVCALAWGLVGHRGRGWLRPQWVVFLGLIPLLALFFGRIPLLGPVANLVAIPVVGWLAVPPALTGAIAELLHAGWGTPLFRASAFVLAHLWPLLEWLQARSFATVAASPPLWALAAAVLGVVLLLAPRGLGVRLAGLGLLVPLFWPPVPTIAPGNYRVTVLDVGQGLAAVVRTAHHVLLIDTGPRWWGGNDAGRSIVIPYLQARGVRAPNKVVLSHADSDHSGGLASIEQQWPGLAVLSGAAVAAHPCHRGEHWRWDGVDFRLLGPDRNRPGTRNNRSCVLKVSAPGGSVLFPSDIERDGEQDLLDDGARLLAAQVLIAPHHGSTTSSTLAFVRAVHPRYVVFSTGYHNRYHFPRPAVVARYRRLGARLLNTAHTGAITFVVNSAHGVRLVARYRMAHSHPWTDP